MNLSSPGVRRTSWAPGMESFHLRNIWWAGVDNGEVLARLNSGRIAIGRGRC
jgi:hypothetical protein